MIDDDRFLRFSLKNWIFGPSDSGSILRRDTVMALVRSCLPDELRAKEIDLRSSLLHVRTFGYDLVTADGSVDCVDDPGEQERITSKLHFCETVTALASLRLGGCFVVKKFTQFEADSVAVMFLLNSCFEQVHVIKPATSKEGNSEVYVVAINYSGCNAQVLEKLLQEVNDCPLRSCVLSRDAVTSSFLEQHRACCEKFLQLQKEAIESNVRKFHEPLDEGGRAEVEQLKDQTAQLFLNKCQLRPIRKNQRIVRPWHYQQLRCTTQAASPKVLSPGASAALTPSPAKRAKQHSGSFTERKEAERRPQIERLLSMTPFLLPDDRLLAELCLGFNNSTHVRDEVEFVNGSRISSVTSSQFCDKKLLKLYRECLACCQEEKVAADNSNDSSSLCDVIASIKHLLSLPTSASLTFVCGGSGEVADILSKLSTISQLEVLSLIEGEEKRSAGDRISLIYAFEALSEQASESQPCATSTSAEMRLLVCRDALTNCLAQLPSLKTGDHVLLCLHMSITRFSTCVLYILSRCFRQVQFYDVFVKRSSMFVFCCDFDREKFMFYSELVENVVTQERASDVLSSTQLLQFLSMQTLLTPHFFSSVSHANNSILQRRINACLAALTNVAPRTD